MSGNVIRLSVEPAGIPNELKARDVWICWRVQLRDGDPTKTPIDPETGGAASSTDDSTWCSFDTALEFHRSDATDTAGIGFVFSPTGPFIGVDLDDCRDPDSGTLEEWARDWLVDAGTYVEWSPSATGAHAYGYGEVPDGGNRSGNVEMYDEGRFFTVTGAHASETPTEVRDYQNTIDELHAEYIGADTAEPGIDTVGRDSLSGPVDLNDRELIEKAKSADDGGKFRQLWNGDTTGYDSHSEARMALLNKLAFWTGGDGARMDRLYQDSGLYPHPSKPEKWERVGNAEITKAIHAQSEYYDPNSGTQTAAPDGGAAAATPGSESGPAAPDGSGKTWADVKRLFDSTESGTTTRGYGIAADLLDAAHDFVTIRETSEFYYYDPEVGYYVRKGETFLQEQLEAAIPGYVNNNRWRNIRDRVKAANYIEASEFTPPQSKVCVRNGVLDLDTRELEPHSPNYYFTARLQTPYDPDADPDLWPEFLSESVVNDGERKKLEEFIGYCLEVWQHNREKNLFIVGPRQSGKSTFLHVLQGLFGDAPTVTNLTPQQLADTQFDASNLKEAILNAVNDINATKIEDSGSLKRIFSGERLKLERKYQDPHFGAPTAKHVYTANWLPHVVGQDESLYRRVLITEFPYRIDDDERDEQLKQKLLGELPGILNRALDARDCLHEQGGFTNDCGDTETRRKWDSWRDAHKRFLYTQFEITGDSDDTVDKGTYYQAYKEFAARGGYELKPQQGATKSLKWVPEISVHDESYSGLAWRNVDAADESIQVGLSDSQKQRVSKVKQWVSDFSTPVEAADRDAILTYADEQGHDLAEIESAIKTLLRRGELIEPTDGQLRRT